MSGRHERNQLSVHDGPSVMVLGLLARRSSVDFLTQVTDPRSLKGTSCPHRLGLGAI